jgi:hypothetical protein
LSSDEKDDAGGLTPVKEDDKGGRQKGRKDVTLLLEIRI